MSQPNTQSQSAQGPSTHNEVDKESVNKMWSLYMNEAKDYDTRLTTLWKDDADSLLVFTGIFASIATASVIESYKKLSPDPGDRTIALLEQISQQLSGAANGTFVPPSTAPPFSPSFSIICCNIMWLLSLVLGITSAMCATLMKQWARRYVNLPQIPSEPSRSARVRSFLFLGILKYQVLLAVDLPTTLLHLSVFFFGIGLLFFFYTIFTTVAIFLSVAVGILGFAYFILTILPWVDRSCPYNTPWSGIFWFFWHTFIPSAAFCLHWLSRKLHGIIMPQTLGQVTSSWRGTLASGLDTLEKGLRNHMNHFKNAFLESVVVREALNASMATDLKALDWQLRSLALAERSKFEDFLASITEETTVQLMSDLNDPGKMVFRENLLTLLRSCLSDKIELDEDLRTRRLSICLDAIHNIAKASAPSGIPNVLPPPKSLLDDVRINFANIDTMKESLAERDPAIRITARSTCALLARNMLRKNPLEQSELAWLQEVLGKPSDEISKSLSDLTTVDNMNIDSFVYGVLSYPLDELAIKQRITLLKTLGILLGTGSQISLRKDVGVVGSAREIFKERLSELIERAKKDPHLSEVVDELHKLYEDAFPPAI